MQNVFAQSHAAILAAAMLTSCCLAVSTFSFYFCTGARKICWSVYFVVLGIMSFQRMQSKQPSLPVGTWRHQASNLSLTSALFCSFLAVSCICALLFVSSMLTNFSLRHDTSSIRSSFWVSRDVRLISSWVTTHAQTPSEMNSNDQIELCEKTATMHKTNAQRSGRQRGAGMLLHFTNVLPTQTEQTGLGAQTPQC